MFTLQNAFVVTNEYWKTGVAYDAKNNGQECQRGTRILCMYTPKLSFSVQNRIYTQLHDHAEVLPN